jgi:hypothetical protein
LRHDRQSTKEVGHENFKESSWHVETSRYFVWFEESCPKLWSYPISGQDPSYSGSRRLPGHRLGFCSPRFHLSSEVCPENNQVDYIAAETQAEGVTLELTAATGVFGKLCYQRKEKISS